jgi:hypothetical protein
MFVPRPWLGLVLLAAAVSAVRLNFGGDHAVSGTISVSALTAILLAMIWLPALVRVLAIAGGEIKTPAGQATTPGVGRLFDRVDPETKRETFPSLLAALTSPGVLTDPVEHDEGRLLRREIGTQLAAVTPTPEDPGQALKAYARDYEAIRQSSASGEERTREMTRLTAEVRALATGLALTDADLKRMLERGQDGERIVALAVIQDRAYPEFFDVVCAAIRESHSAFEQYHALVAMLEMVPLLDLGQRRRLESVLSAVRADPVRAVNHDTSRASLMDALGRWLR